MKMKRSVRYFLIAAISVASSIPLAWVISTAIRPEGQIQTYPPRWIPKTVTLENFEKVTSQFAFGRWMLNSLIVALVATISVVAIDALAGYALARFQFRGNRFLFNVLLVMLLVPIQVTIIPLFLIFAKFGQLDTYSALILPTLGNITGVFLLRQYFLSFPLELEEAARLDGAGPLRVWWSVVLPLSRPALAAVGTLTFMSSWNSFLWPLIATNSDRSRTLPVGIAQFFGGHSGVSGSAPAFGPPLAAAVMATLPALIVFLVLQKAFVQGITSTGVKN